MEEIDRRRWRQIDFNSAVIHIQVTEAGGLKTEDSTGDVAIDPAMVSLLHGFRAKARGQFVIEGGGRELTASKPWGQRYRCEDVFYRLIRWLRENGIDSAKPIHTLRKEAGSIIATKAGIHAASRFLRHADIQITSMHYADHKERVSVDMGRSSGRRQCHAVSRGRPQDRGNPSAKKSEIDTTSTLALVSCAI